MSMNKTLDILFAQWTRLGAGFNTEPSAQTPDLERLLLDTARHSPEAARLFIMAATWLHRYGELIAKNRLKRLINDELAIEHRPTLGLLLDIAQQGTHPLRFQSIISMLEPATTPQPLFQISRENAKLAERAERRASVISRKWGMWCDPIEFKDDALRPSHWVMARNDGFITRADFRGDLRSSILAALRHDPQAGESEYKLARLSGGSRAQVRNSLENLAMTGRISRDIGKGVRRNGIALLERAYTRLPAPHALLGGQAVERKATVSR